MATLERGNGVVRVGNRTLATAPFNSCNGAEIIYSRQDGRSCGGGGSGGGGSGSGGGGDGRNARVDVSSSGVGIEGGAMSRAETPVGDMSVGEVTTGHARHDWSWWALDRAAYMSGVTMRGPTTKALFGGKRGSGSAGSATTRGTLSQAEKERASFVRCQNHIHATSGAVMAHRNTITRTNFPDERSKSKNRRTPGRFGVATETMEDGYVPLRPRNHIQIHYILTPPPPPPSPRALATAPTFQAITFATLNRLCSPHPNQSAGHSNPMTASHMASQSSIRAVVAHFRGPTLCLPLPSGGARRVCCALRWATAARLAPRHPRCAPAMGPKPLQ